MRGNIAQMMQKAQRMQENMQKVQEELAQMEVTGQSGGGVVKITITGKMEARKVQLDPAALTDAEMLEDLIVAAFNDAVAKANDESNKRMAAVTAGMSSRRPVKTTRWAIRSSRAWASRVSRRLPSPTISK